MIVWEDAIEWICWQYCKVDAIIVDAEFLSLLGPFRTSNPNVPFIIDTDSTIDTNPFDQAVEAGLKYDQATGNHGWADLQAQAHDEDDTIAIPFTSGTTAKPKGVVYTHRGSYLASLGNVVESGLNMRDGEGRCGYLWTLPMFHAVGWSKILSFICCLQHGNQLFGHNPFDWARFRAQILVGCVSLHLTVSIV